MRGPKKKKDDAVIETTDIVNIFKDRADPEPQPLSEYPIYVQEFALGDNTIYELAQGAQLGIQHMVSSLIIKEPSISTYQSFIRALKRNRCKYYHERKHFILPKDIVRLL